MSKFATKRFIFSAAVIVGTTWLQYRGHLTPEWYGITVLGCIAGHHAEDLIKAWRGGPAT